MIFKSALPITGSLLISWAALAVSGCGSNAADSAAGSAGTGAQSGANQAGSGADSASGTGGAAAAGHGGAAAGHGGSAAGRGGVGAGGGSGSDGTAGTSGLSCPVAAPGDNAACFVVGACNYSDCAGVGQTTATCDGAKFSVATAPCQFTPCGMTGYPPKVLMCKANEICVEFEGGNAYYACQPDPCAPNALSCACGAAVCGANSTCSVQNSTLICACKGGCA